MCTNNHEEKHMQKNIQESNIFSSEGELLGENNIDYKLINYNFRWEKVDNNVRCSSCVKLDYSFPPDVYMTFYAFISSSAARKCFDSVYYLLW